MSKYRLSARAIVIKDEKVLLNELFNLIKKYKESIK